MKRLALFVAAWLGWFSFLPAEDRLPSWRSLHDRGVEGDAKAVVECIETLQAVLAREPENQLARVYLGSAYTLRSRDLWIGPKKLETLKQGGAFMDQAVAAAPDDPRVRLVRAVNSLKLPRLFGRRKLAIEDFEKLLLNIETLAPEEQQAVYFFAGTAFEDEGQRKRAIELWEKGLRLSASTETAAKLRALLQRDGSKN